MPFSAKKLISVMVAGLVFVSTSPGVVFAEDEVNDAIDAVEEVVEDAWDLVEVSTVLHHRENHILTFTA